MPSTRLGQEAQRPTGLLHTLFTLENRYGLTVWAAEGEIVLRVDVRKNKDAAELYKMLCAWQEQAAKLKAGAIGQEDYDN